jgi:hypothetical protein
MSKTATKTRVTKKQVIAHRTRAVKDTSPTWGGCEAWTADEFHRHFKRAMTITAWSQTLKVTSL